VRERILATVLCLEITRAAELAVRLGDRRWGELRRAFDGAAQQALEEFRGRSVSPTREGISAIFDGPGRAIHCAETLRESARPLGLEIRAGLHTGECELEGGIVGGVAVHLAARVLAHAGPNEIAVSGTVRDLVAGSGIAFSELGVNRLKGLPGDLRLFRVEKETDPTPTGRPATVPEPVALARSRGTLSRREREIAALVALGLSNRQIAEELVISPATAERHLANILSKLDFHARAQVAAWAVDQGLLRAQ
jgi:class 3 adenylate cyclase/DNA-binding CsgD family transcriptional regulator